MLLSWCSYPLVLMTVGISIEQQIDGGHEEEGASVSIVCFSGCLRASLLSFISPRPIVILVLGKLSPLFYSTTACMYAFRSLVINWEAYWPLQSVHIRLLFVGISRHPFIHSFDNIVMEFCTGRQWHGSVKYEIRPTNYDITGRHSKLATTG